MSERQRIRNLLNKLKGKITYFIEYWEEQDNE